MKIFILIFLAAYAFASKERIVGGNEVTDLTMAPWQVSLQKANSHFCGGSLVSEMFVMSACHCENGETTANFGDIEYAKSPQKILVQTFTCHPSWSMLQINFDYAVLKLSRPVILSDTVNIIAFPKEGEEFANGTPALITGWGLTEGTAENVPDKLQYAHTQLLDVPTCEAALVIKRITNQMQCAGLLDNTACNGDSGGPLAVFRDGEWVLVGNTSFGIRNCPLGAPSVWSKNSAVLPWIREVMLM